MSTPIAPLREADMPERTKPFWKMTGPGAILAGLSIGSGELIIWPWITAKFGPSMAWAAALGVFLQLWINIEIGRWAVATGESPFTGFSRFWKWFAGIFVFFNVVLVFLPGWARATGSALKILILGLDGWGPDWFWTAVTFLGVALILFGPKQMYSAVERAISAMVFIIVAGLVYVAFRVGTLDAAGDMVRGVFNVGHIEHSEDFPFSRFFGAVVFAGAGGLGNLFYAYYLRDKQIGMGGRIPRLYNPLRQREESDVQTGFIFADTEENARRFRDWFRFVILDQTLYFWLLTTFMIFLFMFGAYAVLYPKGLVPAEGQLLWDEAVVMGEVMGNSGRYLFLLIGMAALFSTQLTVVDGGARTMADILHTSLPACRHIPQNRLYFGTAIGVMVIGVISTWFLDRYNISALGFIFTSALISGFAMAIYTPLLLVINMTQLPKSARPRLINIAMMAIATAVYGSFALYTAWLLLIR